MATNDFSLLAVENTGGALALRRRAAGDVVQGTAPAVVGSAAGALVVIRDAAGERVLRDLKVNIEPIQTGSGDPSPDNVRPITGTSAVKIVHHGTNEVVVNADTFKQFGSGGSWSADGSITSGSGVSAVGVLVPIKAGFTYRIAVTRVSGGTSYRRYATYSDKPGAWDSGYRKRILSDSSMTTNYRTSNLFTANEGEKYLYVGMYKSNNASQFKITDLSVRVDEEIPYVPGALDVTDVSFPSEAGTVYGGVLDLTAGTLTVGWGNIASYAGETLPGEWISSMDVYSPEAVPTTGAQVVYALAEPVVYQLTPVQIEALAGMNVVYADVGSVEVEYVRDTGAAIDAGDAATRAMIGKASGETASRSLAVGEYVTVGEKFYKVTAAIGQGETLTPGTNVTETTVGAELNALFGLINA